jgi:hypothetical protein
LNESSSIGRKNAGDTGYIHQMNEMFKLITPITLEHDKIYQVFNEEIKG